MDDNVLLSMASFDQKDAELHAQKLFLFVFGMLGYVEVGKTHLFFLLIIKCMSNNLKTYLWLGYLI